MVKLPVSSQEYLFHHSIGVICFIVLFAFFILHRAYLLFHDKVGKSGISLKFLIFRCALLL